MYGPKQLGFWSSHRAPNMDRRYQLLRARRRYRVVRAFTDYDGDVHPAGEQWTFMGTAFLPHADGLSMFVSPDDVHEWHIRMGPEQRRVRNEIGTYVQRIPRPPPGLVGWLRRLLHLRSRKR